MGPDTHLIITVGGGLRYGLDPFCKRCFVTRHPGGGRAWDEAFAVRDTAVAYSTLDDWLRWFCDRKYAWRKGEAAALDAVVPDILLYNRYGRCIRP